MSVQVDALSGEGFALTLTLRDLPTQEEWRSLVQAWFWAVRHQPGFLRLHWVVEWQERGVPHLHVALYGEGWTQNEAVRALLAWLSRAERFGAIWEAQDLHRIDGAIGWLLYLSKHAARGVKHYQRESAPETWDTTGRLYGFLGNWPFVPPTTYTVTPEGYYRLRRLIRSFRIAEARAALERLTPRATPAAQRSARRRLVGARRSLRITDRSRSAAWGRTDWVPEYVQLLLVMLLELDGQVIPESADEARDRVLGDLPTPAQAEEARLSAVYDLLGAMGAVELDPEPV